LSAVTDPTAAKDSLDPPRIAAASATPPIASDGNIARAAPAAVFEQQLCEVQLLMDHISGHATLRLPDADASKTAGLEPDWIRKICEISSPPEGSPAAQAVQEALLVRVKDYLNTMASPANGASIAFTLLVAQEDNSTVVLAGRAPGAPVQDSGEAAGASRSSQVGNSYSRISLAQTAFPGMVPKARSFRVWLRIIGYGLALWLFLTCLLSWYVALGNARLGQVSIAESTIVAARAKLAATSPPAGEASTLSPDTLPNAVPGTDAATYCAAGGAQPPECGDIARARAEAAAAQINVRGWMLIGSQQSNATAMIYDATSALSVLGSGVLPVFYGILGAGAAVLRLLGGRMRLSLLMPRDIDLALQQLALGAVIGACIGLFVSPAGSADANLLGTVSLSSSALSFVAGFGVEGVFATLEALIARIFNIAPSPAPVAQ
jgi:hypothetical protein